MADPLSFRSMRVLMKPGGNEAEIAVSDFDSRKHVVLQPPAGALPGWKPPVDNAPEGERVEDERPVPAPSRTEGVEARAGRFSTRERFTGEDPGAVERRPGPGEPGYDPNAPEAGHELPEGERPEAEQLPAGAPPGGGKDLGPQGATRTVPSPTHTQPRR